MSQLAGIAAFGAAGLLAVAVLARLRGRGDVARAVGFAAGGLLLAAGIGIAVVGILVLAAPGR